MKRIIGPVAGLAALVVVIGGCATAPGSHAAWHTGWDKPDLTVEQFRADVRACDREADRVAAIEPGHRAGASPGPRTLGPGPLAPLRQVEHEKAYAQCMRAKGYTPAKQS